MMGEQEDRAIRGKAYVLGDDVDTDQIIPAQYLNLVPTIPEEYRKLGSLAFAGLPDQYPRFVNEGECESEFAVVIAGKNFGCGSSREHAPVCLGAAGVKAVIARSYARIFFRNAVATGELYPLEVEEDLHGFFSTGDEVEVSVASSRITNAGTGRSFKLGPLGAVGPVVAAGGLFGYARATGMIPQGEETDVGGTSRKPAISEAGTQQRVATNRRRGASTRVIAVANQKGGVGKTTTVVNLAACLDELKQRVLVVDLDPQANATSGFGLSEKHCASIYRTLLGEGHVANLIQETAMEGVRIIPSELDLAGAEVDVARMDEYLHCLADTMEPLMDAELFDYVLLDCPPSLGIMTMNALTAADSLLVPIQCEYYALEGLSVITNLVRRLRGEGQSNPRLEMEGILMTMYDGRTRLSAEVVKEVRKHFGKSVYRTVIPRNVRLSEAPSFGQPVIQYDRHSSGAKAYRRFSREFLKRARRRAREDAG